MLARRLLALLALATTACVAAAGCAVSDDDASTTDGDDGVVTRGDGDGANDLVSERQLGGSEMAAKTVSLTFDDGPGRRSAELADYLAEQGIVATFFINGMNVPGRQRMLSEEIAKGHLIANHTQNHVQLTKASPAKILSELRETDAILRQLEPSGPFLVRAPFGAWNASVARTVNGDANLKPYIGSVFWDEGGELTASSAADWDCWGKGVSIQRCGELYLQEIRSKGKGVVLMHDIHDKTIDMVKQVIVPALLRDGYRFSPLVDVPSVRRALGNATSTPATGSQCSSATLGHAVDENVCVQSASNQRWSRCVDGEWVGSTGPSDVACTKRFPL